MSSGSEEECCSLVVVIVVMMGAFETGVIRRLKIEEVKKIGGLCWENWGRWLVEENIRLDQMIRSHSRPSSTIEILGYTALRWYLQIVTDVSNTWFAKRHYGYNPFITDFGGLEDQLGTCDIQKRAIVVPISSCNIGLISRLKSNGQWRILRWDSSLRTHLLGESPKSLLSGWGWSWAKDMKVYGLYSTVLFASF